MEWRVEGTELDIVGGQQTSFGPVLHDGSWHCPGRQHNWLLRIIHVGCWYQHVVPAVQKCDNVVCVVWARGDTAVEDICGGCAHRNIPAALARIIEDGSVTDDVPSPSVGGGISENELAWPLVSTLQKQTESSDSNPSPRWCPVHLETTLDCI